MGNCQPQCMQIQVISSQIDIMSKRYNTNKKLFQNSMVVKQQRQKLIDFFCYSIIQTRPLYRGYQSAAIKRFLNSHGKKRHTVILCKTQKDLIIGAYSPASHLYSHQKNEPIVQFQQESGYWVKEQYNDLIPFTFSITHRQKYSLNKPSQNKQSIFRFQNQDKIMFGKGEFLIEDQKQKRVKFSANIKGGPKKLSYNWKIIPFNFHGQQEPSFEVKIWEIWQLRYQQLITTKILQRRYYKELIINSFIRKPETYQKLFQRQNGKHGGIQKFIKRYGKQTDILFILKAKGNKIFALFSAPSHQYSSSWNDCELKHVQLQGSWIIDQNKESFVYSISQKKKFQLKDSKRAIFRCKSRNAICFGIGEFIIQQKNNGYNFKILRKMCFDGDAYIEKDQVGLDGFMKEETLQQFQIQAWQAWKISFEQEQAKFIQDSIKQTQKNQNPNIQKKEIQQPINNVIQNKKVSQKAPQKANQSSKNESLIKDTSINKNENIHSNKNIQKSKYQNNEKVRQNQNEQRSEGEENN